MCEILESTCRKHKVLCITPTQRVCHFVNLNVCFFLWNSFGYFLFSRCSVLYIAFLGFFLMLYAGYMPFWKNTGQLYEELILYI